MASEEQNVTANEDVDATIGSRLISLVDSQYNIYCTTEDPKMAMQCVRNIVALCDKYKTLYQVDEAYYAIDRDCETKLEIAKMEAENKLAIAKLEAKTRVDLSEIDANIKIESSKIENETKRAICDAENVTKVNIANAELDARKKEYILNVVNAGLNVSVKAAGAGLAYLLVKEAFIAEFNNGIIGKATGTRLADKIGAGFLSRLITF